MEIVSLLEQLATHAHHQVDLPTMLKDEEHDLSDFFIHQDQVGLSNFIADKLYADNSQNTEISSGRVNVSESDVVQLTMC